MILLGDKRREKAAFEVKPNVLRDIKTLSEISGFSVDTIVNQALEEVLFDNKFRFISRAVYEHFMYQLEDAKDEFEPFEMGGLRVEMKYNDDKMLEVRGIIKDEAGKVVDDHTKVLSDTSEELDEWLKSLGLNIDYSSKEAQMHAIGRTDYREIYCKRE